MISKLRISILVFLVTSFGFGQNAGFFSDPLSFVEYNSTLVEADVFDGSNLGTVNSLVLNGSEIRTFKNSGGDVTGAFINYRIYEESSATGSFTEESIPFGSSLGGTGDQLWETSSLNIDLISGLGAGDYKFEVYFKISTNEGNKFQSNSGANYTADFTLPYRTASDGNWSTTSIWIGGSVPPTGAEVVINHDVTLDQNAEVSNITITTGNTLTSENGQGRTLTIQNSETFTNNGTFTANDGNVIFQGNNVISSSSGTIFNNVTLNNSGVDFDTNSTINGNLTINSGGFVDTNSPIYGSSSTLIYNTASSVTNPYQRRSEWSNAGNQGRPNNVIVQNNTAINMGFDNTTKDAVIDGNLTIKPGSSIFMDFGSDNMEAPLIVKGDFENNGTIALSNLIGGDLTLQGNFTNTGNFNANGRAVFLTGSKAQSIDANINTNIEFLNIDKTGGSLQLNDDLSVSDILTFEENNTIDFELNGHKLSLEEDPTIDAGNTGKIDGSTASSTLELSGNVSSLPDGLLSSNSIQNLDLSSGGTISIDTDLTINNSLNTSNGDHELPSSHVLTLNGALNVNSGSFTFRSKTDGSNGSVSAQIANSTGSSFSGDVIVERYVPKSNRAFRYISSPVNTSGTINDNLQEGFNNTDPNNNPDDINDFGTHITGSQDGSSGFDATSTGNSSMFTWDEANQEWDEIPNTDTKQMSVGESYALMIRGDRSTTLNSNTAVGPATTLRFTGTLVGGNQSVAGTNLSSTIGNYNLIANPYQAIVDAKTLLESGDATDLDDQTIYVYDPTLGTQGGYGAIDISMGTPTATPEADNLTGPTDANQFILPNQAFFVETTGTNPSLTFKKTYKNTSATFVDTFLDDDDLSEMHINLKRQPEDVLVDGVTARFSPDHTNSVNNADADEVWNFDEWVALFNSDNYLSIEKRATPVENDTIQIYTGNYQSDSYIWQIDISNMNREAVLVDTYLDTETPLNANNETSIAFDIDSNIPASTDPFRFSIRFTDETLAVDDPKKTNFSVYPNPVTNSRFTVNGLQDSGNATIQLFDMTSKLVFTTTKSAENTMTIDIDRSLPSGVYQLNISQNQSDYQSTLIISE